MSTDIQAAADATLRRGVTHVYSLLNAETVNGTYANGAVTTSGTQVMRAGKYVFEAWGTWDGGDITLTGKTALMTNLLANSSINLTSTAPRITVDVAEGEYVAATLANAGASTSLSAALTLIEGY